MLSLFGSMIKKNIPNAITCCNLICGCLAIVKAFEGDLVWASYLIGMAAVFDFFDGFAARMLKVSSPIGKDLDSLADMVTFGVVPGVIMFHLIKNSMFQYMVDGAAQAGWTIYPPLSSHSSLTLSSTESNGFYDYLKYFAFIIPVLSAVRLAKFNNDTRQSESFIGLPTPANAILIASLPLILAASKIECSIRSADPNASCPEYTPVGLLINNPYILCGIAVLMSFLLVSPIPLFSLKFKKFGWKGNEIRYIFLACAVLLMVFLQFLGIPLVILFYVLFSVGNNLIKRGKKELS